MPPFSAAPLEIYSKNWESIDVVGHQYRLDTPNAHVAPIHFAIPSFSFVSSFSADPRDGFTRDVASLNC